MTNTELLREKIDQSGYKLRFIAEKIGITYQGLLNKINNRSEFRANEIQALYDLLDLTEGPICAALSISVCSPPGGSPSVSGSCKNRCAGL